MRIDKLSIIFSLLASALFGSLYSSLAFAEAGQEFCTQYAKTAISQYEQNQQSKCGYEGSRWSNNEIDQMQWCLTVRPEIAKKENEARQGLLERCAAQKKTSINPIKATSTNPLKSSTVQQLFPQKTVFTNLQKLNINNLESFFKKIRLPHYNFALSSSARWLALGSFDTNDSSLKLWDLEQGKLLYLLGDAKKSSYHRLSFSPDETLLLTGNNETTDVWDWKNARLLFSLKDHFLVEGQVYDQQGKAYLVNKNRQSVSRFNLSDGKLEKSWDFASKHEEIRGFALSKNDEIALTIRAVKNIQLKVYSTRNNTTIHQEVLPPYSLYNKEGNYFLGHPLGFIDGNKLAFYNLKSQYELPLISILNLHTKEILQTFPAGKMGVLLDEQRQLIGKVDLCPDAPKLLNWKNKKDIQCSLKQQQVKNNRIVSTYQLKLKNRYLKTVHSLHDKSGKLLAFFAADSSARWYWLNAESGDIKNSGAFWDDLPSDRTPYIYHFSSPSVSVIKNQKTTKNYPLLRDEIKRLEIFMGADANNDFEPNISPEFGNNAISHNGRWLVIGSLPGDNVSAFSLWDLETGSYVQSFQSKNAWSNSAIAFSPDDRYLTIYYGSTRGHYAPCIECQSIIEVWDLKRSQYKFSIPGIERLSDPSPPVIYGNGDMYLNIGNKSIQRWNINKEQFIDTFRKAEAKEEFFAVTSNNDDLLAISVKKILRDESDNKLLSAKGWIEIWSASQRKLLTKIEISDRLIAGGLEFNTTFVSKDSLAVATRLSDVTIWNALNGEKEESLVPSKKEFGFTYHLSSDGDGRLITANKYIQVWDVSTGQVQRRINACQPEMPGLAPQRYADLKEYHGSGSAKVSKGKIISSFNCPQGSRSKLWDMKTGELKALYGKNYNDEWFWLGDQEILKSTLPPPPKFN